MGNIAVPRGNTAFWRVYRLSGLLRGQAGSRGLMPDTWHPGSRVVLLNGVPGQIALPTAARGIERHYRFGPAAQPMSDPSYRYETHAFAGQWSASVSGGAFARAQRTGRMWTYHGSDAAGSTAISGGKEISRWAKKAKTTACASTSRANPAPRAHCHCTTVDLHRRRSQRGHRVWVLYR